MIASTQVEWKEAQTMRVSSMDIMIEALRLLQPAPRNHDGTGTHSEAAATGGDLVELFLAELRARRKRLKHWIRLLSRGEGRAGQAAVTRPRYRGAAAADRRRKSRSPRRSAVRKMRGPGERRTANAWDRRNGSGLGLGGPPAVPYA